MSITQKQFDELWDGWYKGADDDVLKQAGILEATHVVIFENHQLDSSQLGRRTAVLVGPNCTYHAVADCEGRWLYDLPSQRQYPQAYAEIPKVVAP